LHPEIDLDQHITVSVDPFDSPPESGFRYQGIIDDIMPNKVDSIVLCGIVFGNQEKEH
jgi:hypothetical protein